MDVITCIFRLPPPCNPCTSSPGSSLHLCLATFYQGEETFGLSTTFFLSHLFVYLLVLLSLSLLILLFLFIHYQSFSHSFSLSVSFYLTIIDIFICWFLGFFWLRLVGFHPKYSLLHLSLICYISVIDSRTNLVC